MSVSAASIKAVLLDFDQVATNATSRHQTEALAKNNGIDIIWQDICHETLLLHQIDGFQAHKPPTAAKALVALRKQWPDYQKPLTQSDLSKKFDIQFC
ncbi:hypothetical protein C9413_32485 [Rhizobium sp. SEMIA 4085]|uniref:hypothetical protein n=1 Tax=Rhizobium TaxID=379 RepID=UPI000586EB41|nr:MULTISPECIES: hypothetical protein [Rhizobium]NNH33906.1 hypothetical protein [Rhizobium sp. SEMIA 4085]TDW37028.1 hypothetical protein EV128_101503 [Rhizobium azibense]